MCVPKARAKVFVLREPPSSLSSSASFLVHRRPFLVHFVVRERRRNATVVSSKTKGKKRQKVLFTLSSTLSLSLSSSSSSLSDIEEHISFATRTKRKLSLAEEALVYLRTKKQTLNREREREREREMTRNTSSDEMETKSTKELFALAREKMTTRTSSGINGGGDNDGSFFLREAIEMFAEVFRRCDSAGCFDDDDANNGGENEENFGGDNRRGGENVSTNDLKYALCLYFQGKCWQSMRTEFVPLIAGEAEGEEKKTTMVMNRELRVEHVLRGKECLERFLRFASAARFLPRGFEKDARAAAGLIEEEEDDDDDDDDDGGTTREAMMTPEAKRTMKVKRFKKQSELRRKLEEMEKSGVVDRCARVKSRTAEEEEEEEGEEEADEEKVREYWFAMIEKAVLDSIEMIEGSKEEVALLTGVSEDEVRRIVQGGEKKQQRGGEEESSSSRIPGELLKAIASLESNKNNNGTNGRNGMMNRSAPPAGTSAPTVAIPSLPSSLFANRKESVVRDARSALFRPSHILPTMSIEEAGEIELRELMERTALSKEREKRKSVLESAKTEDELSDEKLYEKRRWDDWKDDNPFGAGNSRRTPTGNNR